jgi:hypothetical protein
MSTRIDRRFADLAGEGRAGLVTFLMAGDPDPETSLAIIKALPQAGADVVEIGMPFTDPMADGPAIQALSAPTSAKGRAANDRYKRSPKGKAAAERYRRSERGKSTNAKARARSKTKRATRPAD